MAGLSLAACGGSGEAGGDEAPKVRNVLEAFFRNADACDLQSQRLLMSQKDETEPGAALDKCRSDESAAVSRRPADVGFGGAHGATPSEISVDGGGATAEAEVLGGQFDGQTLDVTLVKRGDDWKIDRLDGLTIDDRFRARTDRVLRDRLRRTVAAALPADRVEPTLDCIISRGRRAFPNERLAADIEGNSRPGAYAEGLRRIASSCLTADPRTAVRPGSPGGARAGDR
jgi:hypothetical protein